MVMKPESNTSSMAWRSSVHQVFRMRGSLYAIDHPLRDPAPVHLGPPSQFLRSLPWVAEIARTLAVVRSGQRDHDRTSMCNDTAVVHPKSFTDRCLKKIQDRRNLPRGEYVIIRVLLLKREEDRKR